MCARLFSVVLVLTLASITYGQVVIGNWESVMDGWLIDPCAPPGTTTNYSTAGVTLDTESLRLTVPQSGWKQVIYIPLENQGMTDEFFDNDVFSLDVTRLASEWTINDPCDPNLGWSELHLIVNANSVLGPVWNELGAGRSGWDWGDRGTDVTQTAKWDYSGVKAQIDEASISHLQLILVSNYDPNYTSGGVYYLDKARLEPISYLNVIGNFENVLDHWVTGDPGTIFNYASTGVTLDDMSLSVTTGGPGKYWVFSWNAPTVPTSLAGVILTFDVTMIDSGWPSTWTKVADKVALNSDVNQPGAGGWKEYYPPDVIDRITGLPTSNVWDSGTGDAYKSFSIDISDYNVVGATWFQINISVQSGSPGNFYFDNIRLSSAGPAYNPDPADGAREQETEITLSWTPGLYAHKHDVYFGTNSGAVSDATRSNPLDVLVRQNQDPNTYDPGGLDPGRTYYWRIDEVNGPDIWRGEVWNFATAYAGAGIVIGDWEYTLDGWTVDSSATPSYSSTGATLNDKSLQLDVESDFHWVLQLILSPEQLEALKANDTFSLDVTWVTSEWAGASWSQVQWIAINSAATAWSQIDGPTSDTSNPGSPGEWGPTQFGDSDTRTITWNYSGIDVDSIEEGGWCHFHIATNHDTSIASAPYYFDNARFIDSRVASIPNPPDRDTDVESEPTLSWKSGTQAVTHDVYFGTNFDDVGDVNRTNLASYPDVTYANVDVNSYKPGTLELETVYYWRIDEVNDPDIWKGAVWTFMTGGYVVVDDFEDYNNTEPYTVWNAWADGYGDPTNGSTVGYPKSVVDAGGDYVETEIVHGGDQSMPLFYDNSVGLSEAAKTLTSVRDWTAEGVKALTLWFRGHPRYLGSFTEGRAGAYTMTASGADIWDPSDEFHFAYKRLSGIGSIVAKVESLQNTSGWAKAGVMIRETLEPGSKHAFACITPGNGVASQGRYTTGGESFNTNQTGITAPHWVKLERDIAGNFTVRHSADGSTWEPVEDATEDPIQMSTDVYIGLALTSQVTDVVCEAVFSNITITGNVTGDWKDEDIGILSNDAEPMYVAVANNTGTPAVVYYGDAEPDPNASQINTWTEWNIDLKELEDQGVVLTDINSVTIGFGDKDNPQAGGSGKMYFDDIRLYQPRCVPDKLTLSEADLNSDCLVGFADLGMMAGDWLACEADLAADINADGVVDFKDYAILADQWLDEQQWPEW